MARLLRKVRKSCSLAAFITSFVFVTTFIYLRDRSGFDKFEQFADVSHIAQNKDTKAPQRQLLKYSSNRKRERHRTLWDTKLKFQSWRHIFEKQLLGQHEGTFTETTPQITETATRPITTQSDTTPLYTEKPTSPITTESITTPIVTEPGERELTTDQEKILLQ